jgi:type IV pilus assembly protein PilC
MPKFAYAAIDTTGAPVEGVTKADTIGAARSILVEQNLFPTKIEERRGMLDFELTKEKVKKKHLMHFTRQLAVFVKAGIPITDALVTIGDETEDVALRRALGNLVDELRNGGLFSAAAAEHPEVFPNYYVGILQSAELTGQLDTALESLSEYLEREIETRSKVVSALSYPMVVMVMAMITVLILAGYVLPQFKPLFEELGAELPLPTRAMLFFSRFFTDLWFITAAIFLVIGGTLMFLFKHPTGKLWKERLVLKIPVIKGIVDYAILERFCRILSAMLAAGVPLPEGLKTTTDACSNVVYRERLDIARAQMLEGQGFSQPLIDTDLFPGAARQMFKVGEETGTLDMQLEVASTYFNRELESRIKRFTTMFEPIMIVFVGLIVGFVAVALVSAMYGVLNGTKGQA